MDYTKSIITELQTGEEELEDLEELEAKADDDGNRGYDEANGN